MAHINVAVIKEQQQLDSNQSYYLQYVGKNDVFNESNLPQNAINMESQLNCDFSSFLNAQIATKIAFLTEKLRISHFSLTLHMDAITIYQMHNDGTFQCQYRGKGINLYKANLVC